MTAEPLDPYTEICRDTAKSSSAKLGKTFENPLVVILLLYTAIQRKINSLRWSVTIHIANRATERISIAAGLCVSTGLGYGLLGCQPEAKCRACCACCYSKGLHRHGNLLNILSKNGPKNGSSKLSI